MKRKVMVNRLFFFKLRIDMELVRLFEVYWCLFEPNVVYVDLVAENNRRQSLD